MFGSDFFKVFYFIFEGLRLIGKVFGNGEDEKGFDDVIAKSNGKTVKQKNAPSKTPKTNG